MKYCKKCKSTKLFTEFYESKRSKDGRLSTCIKCRRAYKATYNNTESGRKSKKLSAKKYWAKASVKEKRRKPKPIGEVIGSVEKSKARKEKRAQYQSSVKGKTTAFLYWTSTRGREVNSKKSRKFLASEKGKVVIANHNAKRRAARNGAAVRDFTAEQWRYLQEHFSHCCAYCGKKSSGGLTQDHITPLSKGGDHTLSNIVPSCRSCNSAKNTNPPIVPVQPLLLIA